MFENFSLDYPVNADEILFRFDASGEIKDSIDEDFQCCNCGVRLVEEGVRDGVVLWCLPCIEPKVEKALREAEAVALKECTLHDDLPKFNAANKFAPTPEEYEAGEKFANTASSFRATLRHEYSNYDQLICFLDKYDFWDCIRYEAIRYRISELVEAVAPDLTVYEIDTEVK